jgi:hypothetical protein
MPRAKPLSKELIVGAMNKTLSNRAAARYLNVSYQHFKKWAKLYQNKEGKEPALLDIIEGRVDAASFTPDKIKYRLISEGHLEEKCNNCNFCERRVSDYKIPVILHFKDKNKQNYRKENIELLCYNCYYLTIGDIFTNKQIQGLEDHKPVNNSEVNWELDDYQKQRLEELGLGDEPEEDYISRI